MYSLRLLIQFISKSKLLKSLDEGEENKKSLIGEHQNEKQSFEEKISQNLAHIAELNGTIVIY